MSFLDRARVAATQAAARAQQGIGQAAATGQAKLDEIQTRRQADALLRDLGAAFYSESRSGGSHDTVVGALAAVDAHVAKNGAIETTPSGVHPSEPAHPADPAPAADPGSAGLGSPTGPADAAGPAGTAAPRTDPPVAGPTNYRLDDL